MTKNSVNNTWGTWNLDSEFSSLCQVNVSNLRNSTHNENDSTSILNITTMNDVQIPVTNNPSTEKENDAYLNVNYVKDATTVVYDGNDGFVTHNSTPINATPISNWTATTAFYGTLLIVYLQIAK